MRRLFEMSDVISKLAFASLVGVSPGRVSQFLSQKKIFGDALVGEGRHARIRVSVALEQLRRNLDLDQRLGANGRVQLDVPAAPAAPDSNDAAPKLEDDIRRQRLEQLELANEKAREEKAARAGIYAKAADVRQELGRTAAHMIAVFDGALAEFATAIAAHSNLPARDALHILRTAFRTIRARQNQIEMEAITGLPELIEDRAAETEEPVS